MDVGNRIIVVNRRLTGEEETVLCHLEALCFLIVTGRLKDL